MFYKEMNLELEMRAKSYIYHMRPLGSKRVMFLKDAIRIAQKYVEEMCKKQKNYLRKK